MKQKVWLFQLPVIALFTFGFLVNNWGEEGQLNHAFLRESIFPTLKVVSGLMSNLKFRLRGPIPPKNKIVIVEVDDTALSQLGRWPWHRDLQALLIEKTFEAGAKVVGLDIAFSEPDPRIPEGLSQLIEQKKMDLPYQQFETDPVLASVIAKHKDKLVLGWAITGGCSPGYFPKDSPSCPANHPELKTMVPAGYEKFAFKQVVGIEKLNTEKTALWSIFNPLTNIPMYNAIAENAGIFAAEPDPDGYVRRSRLVNLMLGKPYSTLAMEVAKVALNEELLIEFDETNRVKRLGFAKSGRMIPVSPLGAMEINFRGPANHFTYVPALDVMADEPTAANTQAQNESGAQTPLIEGDKKSEPKKLQSTSKKSFLKDAIVLIGISALGVFDMRAFPFDSNTPGVEGHANIIDNLLSQDYMRHNTTGAGSYVIFLLMTLGAILFAWMAEKLEAIPGLILFIVIFGGIGVIDQKILFEGFYNWNTSLFYLELVFIFFSTVAVKYVLEERNKKFIKGAFSRYVAPAVVDSILKDPTKLTVGGEKRELTIMFSDIRSFTTFSEKLDAKFLATFLNEYLGLMTDLVFANRGTLDKYIGDAVMAFWGAPLDYPGHAADACRTAIKMQQVLAEYRPHFLKTYDVHVEIGIGINTGAVNVGNMGSSTIFEYTVIGDHVNLASRLEGLTKYYGVGIVTTRFTFDSIVNSAKETQPPHRVLDFVKVKGKKTAVELIQILERELPKDGLLLFEMGRKLYEQQKFNEAIAQFRLANEKLKTADKNDYPCEMYIERCEEFMKNPPSTDWDGSWEMTSK